MPFKLLEFTLHTEFTQIFHLFLNEIIYLDLLHDLF